MIEAEKTYENVLFEQDGAVARVRMNRPEKRNALSLDHMRELISCFKAIGENKESSVVVLGGEGPGFCAGHDLAEMIGRDPEFYRRTFDVCTDLMTTIQAIPQPVIARVDGVATAAGDLRPRRRLRGGPLRHPRRQDRAVLLHPDGRP